MATKKLPKGITLRKDGRYYWRFVYDGQQYSGYERNLKDAEKKLNDTRYEVEHGTFLKSDTITFDEWFEVWVNEYRVDLKDSTREHHKAFYYRYFSPEFGKMRLQNVKTAKIQRWLKVFAETHGEATVNLICVIIRMMLECAKVNHLISENPMDAVMVPQGIKRSYKRDTLTASEVKLFFSYAEGTCYYTLLRFISLTGLRIGEALGLTWDDVDLEKSVIRINHNLSYTAEKGYFLTTPKTKKGVRTVPLKNESIALLHAQRIEQAKLHMSKGNEWDSLETMENLVFTSETGKPICGRNVDCSIRRIVKHMQKDGIEFQPFGVHQLRHAFATRCIEEGMPPIVLSKILGHDSISTTMNKYVGLSDDTIRNEFAKVVNAL